jgi:hypothetical protein
MAYYPGPWRNFLYIQELLLDVSYLGVRCRPQFSTRGVHPRKKVPPRMVAGTEVEVRVAVIEAQGPISISTSAQTFKDEKWLTIEMFAKTEAKKWHSPFLLPFESLTPSLAPSSNAWTNALKPSISRSSSCPASLLAGPIVGSLKSGWMVEVADSDAGRK